MDLAAVKIRLAEIERAIPGISRAHAQIPENLSETDLPTFINLAGSAIHNQTVQGDRFDAESREFTARLYVVPVSSGVTGEAEERVEPFIELCSKAFIARPGLTSPDSPQPLAGIQRLRLSSDTGITRLRFNGSSGAQEYLGIEFKLRIEATVSYEQADSE